MRSMFVLGLVSIGGEYSSLYLYRRTAPSFKLKVFVHEMCSRGPRDTLSDSNVVEETRISPI